MLTITDDVGQELAHPKTRERQDCDSEHVQNQKSKAIN